LASPQRPPTKSPAASAMGTRSMLPRISETTTTSTSVMMAPSDKSMPPPRMTNVWPTAAATSGTKVFRLDWML